MGYANIVRFSSSAVRAVPHRQTKNVYDFIGMWADKVCAEDATRPIFNQRFIAISFFG